MADNAQGQPPLPLNAPAHPAGRPTGGPPTTEQPTTEQPTTEQPMTDHRGQGLLFGEALPTAPPEDEGYRPPTACSAAGITYRQLDYWARTGLVEPSVRSATGSGSQRLYSFRDILVLKVVKRLLEAGVSLHNIRTAVEHLRARGIADLAQITLISDGSTVYECTSADEVVDLLQGGQGVFGIAVGRVVRQVEGELAQWPDERQAGTTVGEHSRDELARRRGRRHTA
jgi:DNA-binding transcriptional MerR regulator